MQEKFRSAEKSLYHKYCINKGFAPNNLAYRTFAFLLPSCCSKNFSNKILRCITCIFNISLILSQGAHLALYPISYHRATIPGTIICQVPPEKTDGFTLTDYKRQRQNIRLYKERLQLNGSSINSLCKDYAPNVPSIR